MLNRIPEEDFAVLRAPLESGRQSPNSLGATLILGIFLQALIFYLVYNIAAESTLYPNVDGIERAHFWITVGIAMLSLIFGIPVVFHRAQRFQYFLSIVVSQNMAMLFYFSALFIIGESTSTASSLLNFTYLTLCIAFLLFLLTFIRFYLLLKKGHYRAGSVKDTLRGKFETTSYIPIAIGAGVGLVLILQYVVRMVQSNFFDAFLLIFLPLAIFYTMIFVLPEQLVILYCKCRFESFNFDLRGYMNPMKVNKHEEKSAKPNKERKINITKNKRP